MNCWRCNGGPAPSTNTKTYLQTHQQAALSTALYPPKIWEQFVNDIYSIFKRKHLENFFHGINNIYLNITFLTEEGNNGELAFLDTLLKRNNGKISVLVHRVPRHTDQYLHYSFHHLTSCMELVVSFLFNRAHSITPNKDDLTKKH